MSRKIGIGLAGFGTVGSGVYKNLLKNGILLEQRIGVEFEVRGIAVRDLTKAREIPAPAALFTTSPEALLADPAVEIVVELMGGIERPLAFVTQAIHAGKIVVTGNKALLAEHGREIFALAKEKHVPVFYEAAVAGGIPIIKAAREAFVGNRFEAIYGILNGTSNYILTRMSDEGLGFEPVLAEAQKLGYAEADPALDVNGWDAAHKAIILASLAYGFWVDPKDVLVEGIEKVTAADIRFAKALGYRIKLLASIKAAESGEIEVRVAPTLIPQTAVLASVNGVFNAVAVRGDVVGEALFYGRGAGQDPTSSSVLSDLADAAAFLQSPRRCVGFTSHDLYSGCKPIEQTRSKYYLRLGVEDRPGVLAQVAATLANADIGILSVIQPQELVDGSVPLVLTLHDAPYGSMKKTADALALLPCVQGTPLLLHMEAFA
jgi:homoserine dehydrogenase